MSSSIKNPTAHHLAVALASLRAPKLGPARVRELAVNASRASKAWRDANPGLAGDAVRKGWATRRRRDGFDGSEHRCRRGHQMTQYTGRWRCRVCTAAWLKARGRQR